MNHEQALLAAIVENPDDDTPRLIYADYIEGQGQTDRAEFIRVQCELEQTECCHLCRPEKCVCNRHNWKLRERELLGTPFTPRGTSFEWIQLRPRYEWERALGEILAGSDAKWEFRRGFIEKVECTCQQWLDHGADVLRACPTIREVQLSDRRPANRTESISGGNNFYWIEDEPGWWEALEERLPYAIYNLLSMQDKIGWHFSFYKSEEKACADLSQACIAYARNQLAKTQPVPT